MSPQPTVTQIRLKNITTSLRAAVNTLDVLSQTLESPFLKPISSTSRSLLTVAETVRLNKGECAELLEQTYKMLYALITVYMKAETIGELSPSMLNHVAQFTETLHKIHTFLEAQRDSRIKQFFRQGEMIGLFKECKVGLQQALDVFTIQEGEILKDVTHLQENALRKHQEVLELIEALSDTESSDRASSINRVFSNSYNSSNSISLLPSEPKIFHGREEELSSVLKLFDQDKPRIAILGAGGMGKTSLARAILHHPVVAQRYQQHRFFVACDSASTKLELAALIGTYLGLKPAKDLTRPVIQYFSDESECLLILDNLETVWEPTETRTEIEDFLSALTALAHLALIITMRGAERPAMVQWTRPFLPYLTPLAHDAARRTFVDIADDDHDKADIDQVLLLTDNLPLAIDLMAHLVDLEGCTNVLSRWKEERTSLISEGYDQRSNLDLSISLSLTGPRIASRPQSQLLLSLLSMLPDGVSDLELIQSKIPIDDILHCKTALVRTSLAYIDDRKKLKALVPIREFMQKFHPPGSNLIQPLLSHFQELLGLYRRYHLASSSAQIALRITSNLSNLHNMLRSALQPDNPDIENILYCILHLNDFSTSVGRTGYIPLMNEIPKVLPRPVNHALELVYLTQTLDSWKWTPVPEPETLIKRALQVVVPHVEDSDLICRFYNILGNYYRLHANDIPAATESLQTALSLAISVGNYNQQSQALTNLAWIKYQLGDYAAGQMQAYEAQRAAKLIAHFQKEVTALLIEATCWTALGSYATAILLCKRARNLLGPSAMIGQNIDHTIMLTQAEVHKFKSEFVEARDIQTQILQQITVEPDPYLHAFVTRNIAEIDLPAGAPRDEVQRNLDASKVAFNTMGYTRGMLWCDAFTGALALREGDQLAAKPLLQTSLKFGLESDMEMATFCLGSLGDYNSWDITGWTSTLWTVLFLVHSVKSKGKLDIHRALQFLGDTFLAEGDGDTAVNLFTVALEGFTQMDVHSSRAECMVRLGDVFQGRGNTSEAVELWNTARLLFERSSQAKSVAEIVVRLARLSTEVQEVELITAAVAEFDSGLAEA